MAATGTYIIRSVKTHLLPNLVISSKWKRGQNDVNNNVCSCVTLIKGITKASGGGNKQEGKMAVDGENQVLHLSTRKSRQSLETNKTDVTQSAL